MSEGYHAVPVTLPEGASIYFGELYWSDDPAFMDEDILAIKLEDGSFLDVGWYPSGSPDGQYVVVHFYPEEGFDEGVPIIHTRDVNEVARTIADFSED